MLLHLFPVIAGMNRASPATSFPSATVPRDRGDEPREDHQGSSLETPVGSRDYPRAHGETFVMRQNGKR